MFGDQLVCVRCVAPVGLGRCASCRAGRAQAETRRRLTLLAAAVLATMAGLAVWDIAQA